MTLLPQVLAFAITLILLLALSRWISRQVQIVGLRLTGSERFAVGAYFFLLLPGILLHELSHMAMAKLLGLRIGRLALGPRRRGKSVELGSVTISSGGTLRDSLVGLAPFLAGTGVLLLVGYRVFDVAGLGQAWATDGWGGVLRTAGEIWRVPDSWLWVYLVFAVSNAMTPSPADRQPWLLAGLYIGIALLAAYLLGGLTALLNTWTAQVSGALYMLTLGFLFTLALDAVAAALLWVVEIIIILVRSRAR